MATPPQVSENAATQRQYVTQLTISAALAQALRTLWASLNPASSEVAWEAFAASVRAVVPQYGQAASVVSLDNYRLTRASAGITTTPRLPQIQTVSTSKIDAGLEWARRFEADSAATLAEFEAKIQGRVDAAMQKALMDEARATTVAAVEGDELALGFRRVPRPDACAWCLTQAIRRTTRRGLAKDFKRYGGPGGPGMGGDEHWGVFKSRAAAGQTPEGADEINRFHNNCQCIVEPIFDAAFVPPEWLRDMAALYDDTDGGLNGFRRALSARRRGDEPASDPRPALPSPAAQEQQVAAIANLLASIAA